MTTALDLREAGVLLLEPASLRRLIGKLRQAHPLEGLATSAAGIVAVRADLAHWAEELGYALPEGDGWMIVLAWPPPRRPWLAADQATQEARLLGELRLQRLRRQLLQLPFQESDAERLKQAMGPLAWAEAAAVLKRDGMVAEPITDLALARELLAQVAVVDQVESILPGCPAAPLRQFLAGRLHVEPKDPPAAALPPEKKPEPMPCAEEPLPAPASPPSNVARQVLRMVAQGEDYASVLIGLKARLRQALDVTVDFGALLELARLTRGHAASEAGRCLFDLQNACLDVEKATYAVDLPGAVRALSRLAVIRPLPLAQYSALLRHLRKARARLDRLASQAPSLGSLSSNLQRAEEAMAQKFRGRLRELLVEVFPRVGLSPRNLPEKIAHERLIAELAERVVEQGGANFADLRDAMARSDLKLPDLAGPLQFLGGDALLKADRDLMVRLDGVYHSGEFYLRWFHRLSTLFFGTGVGRFVTQYLALPFGGSFLVLEFLQHMVAPLVNAISGWAPSLVSSHTIILFGICFLAILHLPRARVLAWKLWHGLGRALHGLFVALPLWIYQKTPLRWLLQSAWLRWMANTMLPPLLATGLVASGLWLYQVPSSIRAWVTPGFFVASLVFLNSRPGRRLRQVVVDSILRSWDFLWVDFVPGLVRLIGSLFHALLEALERIAYAVDEWLRFRQGDPVRTIIAKGVLTVIWFFVAYVLRFAIKLLVEPQINPLKHFPVVTVSHKLLLPTLPAVARTFAQWMPQHALYAEAFAGALITGIPGVFGFLAWELMSNWKLYDANRSPELEPRTVGHHGETVRRLFRPGFHSGTVPVQFARLRAVAAGKARPSLRQKALHELHGVEVALGCLVEWDLLAWLRASKCWRREVPTLQRCALATNQATLYLQNGRGQAWGTVSFFWLNQCLHAAIHVAEEETRFWKPAQESVFSWAIAGLLHRAGVEAPLLPALTWAAWADYWHERRSRPPVLNSFKGFLTTPGDPSAFLKRAVREGHI